MQNINSAALWTNYDETRGFLRPVVRLFSLFVAGLLLITTANTAVRGQLADAFNPNVGGRIFSMALQPDGKIVIGGTFTQVGGQTRNRIARVNSDGTLDTTFANINVDQAVGVIAFQPDGKILIGGIFLSVGGQTRNRLARLNADGTLDTSFNPNSDNIVHAILVQPDGKILIGGEFTSIGGQTRNRLARLNADGTLDNSFTSDSDSSIISITRQPDGKILVGGFFSSINGSPRHRLARLNADGSLDMAFSQPAIPYGTGKGILEIKLQPDGKILIGGYEPDDTSIKAVARLNADGTLDMAFNQNIEPISGVVITIDLQSNGKILFGGIVNNIPRPFRLNADGTRDMLYNPNPTGIIDTIIVQPDQKVLVGGIFSSIANEGRNSLARLVSAPVAIAATKFDFDGDTKADISAFRPSNGTWYIYQSATINQTIGLQVAKTVAFGFASDQLAPADYDGDFKTDIAVFREGAFGYFYVLNSSDNTFRYAQFGTTGDIPVVGDWDGDYKADFAVYRNGATAGAQSYFYYRPTATIGVDFRQLAWGAAGDKPVVGDYDADGKQDAAVFRPSNGVWYVSRSSDNQLQAAQFGIASDKLVAADYDGDNKTDYAVFRAGTWYLQRSQLGFTGIPFGVETDVPAPADYDGDNKTDLGVFRNGTWYLNRSTSGSTGGVFSAAGDKPIPSAFVQ